MRMKIKLEGKNLVFELSDLLYEIHQNLEEFDQLELIKGLGWMDSVLKSAVDVFAEEYSRENYNPDLHKYRKDLLQKVKQGEIEYYAGKIASAIENLVRERRDYWKLYHHHKKFVDEMSNYGNEKQRELACQDYKNTPQMEDIDHDARRELERVIKEAFENDDRFLKDEPECPLPPDRI